MNPRPTSSLAVFMTVATLIATPMASHAGMQQSPEPYVAKPEIRFSIGVARPAPAPRAPLPAQTAEYSNVVVLGEPKERKHSFAGSSDASLRDAVRAIAPSAYLVRSSGCVPLQAPTSYRDGTDWIAALNDIARTNDIDATVDHDTREVMLDRKPAIRPDAKRTWAVLASDATLRRALERWTAPACISLQWDVPFPMEAVSDTFYRDMTLSEALARLGKDLETSNSPVRIVQHRNNTLRVYLDSSR